MDSLPPHSPDLVRRNVEVLAELFPSVVTETVDSAGTVRAAIDFDLLRQELRDHLVEGPQERYQLDWPGRRAAVLAANAPTARTLRPVRADSVDFDSTQNVFIEGDNLEGLKLLQESYRGRVRLIYLDPPYNTGSDLVYADDFTSTVAEHLAASGQVDADGRRLVANPETHGRFHSDWLSMMYPRLRLARTLLADDGLIVVSIDDNEAANLRRLMDQVFGATNFFAELVVVRAEGGGMAKRVVKGHDYLIAYTRRSDCFPGMFRAKDVRGPVVEHDGRPHWIETDWLRAVFGQYGTLAYEDVEAVKGPAKKREIDEGLASGRYRLIPRGEGHIVGRLRPLDSDGSKFHSVLKHLNSTAKQALEPLGMAEVFSNPKPLSLIKEIVLGVTRFSKDDGDLVLDLFAGSGTTAHAVLAANAEDGGNRRYLCVQWPEDLQQRATQVNGPARSTVEAARAFAQSIDAPPTLAEITKERLRRIGPQFPGLDDVGFRAFRIDSSNLADHRLLPEDTDQQTLPQLADTVKPDRTGEDLLVQVLLTAGLDLSSPLRTRQLHGHRVHTVGDDALVASFDAPVTEELVRALLADRPDRVVFLDSAFPDDDTRLRSEALVEELSPGSRLQVL